MLSHIWVKPESNLDQLSTRSFTSSNQYAVNLLTFIVNWLEFDLWHIHNIIFAEKLLKTIFYKLI